MIFGVIIGLIAGIVICAIREAMYEQLLISKSDPNGRTPEKIGEGFYFIVPEGEFIGLAEDRNFWKQQAKAGLVREGDALRKATTVTSTTPPSPAKISTYPRLAE